MYAFSILLLMLVFPLAAIGIEAMLYPGATTLFWLIGKWFTFFAVGVRLFLAGVRQVRQPAFTAAEIFKVSDPGAHPIVREVGFGNLSMGTLGLLTLLMPNWLIPAALAGGLYYGLAGIGHAFNPERNEKEQLALVSDLAIFVLLAVFVVGTLAF
jgi:hypothetical protein